MNQKTAKKLRKVAKSVASEKLVYGAKGNSKKWIPIFEKLTDAELVKAELSPADELKKNPPKIQYHEGTVVVNQNSARGIYKKLKKATKAAK